MGLFGKKKTENACCCGNVDSLIDNKEHTEVSDGCGCDGNCDCGGNCGGAEGEEKESQGVPATNETVIKILGSGCKNCITLADNVKAAITEMQLEATTLKVTDFAEITGYGVMSTPALVVNEKVVSYGKVLKPQEIIKLLEKVL